MIYREINLKDYYKNLKYDVYLYMYVPRFFDDNRSLVRKSLLIIPGGGYEFTSYREGEPIAASFMERGYNTYVLRYNCRSDNTTKTTIDIRYPNHIKEVMCAVDYLRTHTDTYCNPNFLGLVGFSAGGHLTAMYGYDYKNSLLHKELGISGDNLKPNFLMLIYPVTIGYGETHVGSFMNLCGKFPSESYFSIDKNITSDYPITYLMHAKGDPTVPYIGSVILDKALTDNGVIHYTHLFERGWHGFSNANIAINVVTTKEQKEILDELSVWVKEADEFIEGVLKK